MNKELNLTIYSIIKSDKTLEEKLLILNELNLSIFGKDNRTGNNLAEYIHHNILKLCLGRARGYYFEDYRGTLTLYCYSRTGGGNYEDYLWDNNMNEDHELCIYAEEDDYDSTYMDFRFDLSNLPDYMDKKFNSESESSSDSESELSSDSELESSSDK